MMGIDIRQCQYKKCNAHYYHLRLRIRRKFHYRFHSGRECYVRSKFVSAAKITTPSKRSRDAID